MKEVIRVKIKPDATTVVSAEGIAGKKCTEVTEGLENYLGKVGKTEFTADYYKPEPKGPDNWITRR